MAYKVIKPFKDAQDNMYMYHVGDKYPHDNMEVSDERIKELASKNNKRGMALIEAEKEEVKEEAKKPRKRSKKDAE